MNMIAPRAGYAILSTSALVARGSASLMLRVCRYNISNRNGSQTMSVHKRLRSWRQKVLSRCRRQIKDRHGSPGECGFLQRNSPLRSSTIEPNCRSVRERLRCSYASRLAVVSLSYCLTRHCRGNSFVEKYSLLQRIRTPLAPEVRQLIIFVGRANVKV